MKKHETPITIKFQSAVSEIRQYTNKVEFVLAQSNLEAQINETFESFKVMGMIDKSYVLTCQEKITSLKKLVTQLVDNYFASLSKQMDKIVNNVSFNNFKDSILLELL